MPAIYAALAQDETRNDLIFNDVLQALEKKRSPIVLTERKDHLAYLQERFKPFAKNIAVLCGGLSAAERRGCAAALSVPETEERLILATGRYIGEGFDDARLDTLFLTMPISWKGTLAQYVGRLHRDHAGKSDVLVVDYVDGRVPVLPGWPPGDARDTGALAICWNSRGGYGYSLTRSLSSSARRLRLRPWVWMSVSRSARHAFVVAARACACAARSSHCTAIS